MSFMRLVNYFKKWWMRVGEPETDSSISFYINLEELLDTRFKILFAVVKRSDAFDPHPRDLPVSEISIRPG